jgi:hypothetical protein
MICFQETVVSSETGKSYRRDFTIMKHEKYGQPMPYDRRSCSD